MGSVKELISLLSQKEVIERASIAKSHHSCKLCGEPANRFRTPRAELEYAISSICQSCQDYYLPVEH